MRIKELIDHIEIIAPPHLQEEWDNSGIQLLISDQEEIKNILVCLEITEAVVDEAIASKAGFILTHHPLLFKGFRKIEYNTSQGKCLIDLIRNGISVYSAHTSFDSVVGGNNDYLAYILGVKVQAPIEEIDLTGNGIGRVGAFSKPMKLRQAVEIVKSVIGNADVIRTVGETDSFVEKVGICTGAGANMLDKAKAIGCDTFITGDLKYHEAQHAKEIGIAVIDAGHFGTENIFIENFAELLFNKIGNSAEIIKSKVDINPFQW